MFRLQGMQPQSQQGPLARLLATLLLVVVGAIAVFFGAIIIAVLIGFAALLFMFLYLRAWWLRHKLGLNVHPHNAKKNHDSGVTIEGEYTVENNHKNAHDEN